MCIHVTQSHRWLLAKLLCACVVVHACECVSLTEVIVLHFLVPFLWQRIDSSLGTSGPPGWPARREPVGGFTVSINHQRFLPAFPLCSAFDPHWQSSILCLLWPGPVGLVLSLSALGCSHQLFLPGPRPQRARDVPPGVNVNNRSVCLQ